MELEAKSMNVLQLNGSYHQRPMDMYVYSPIQYTDIVTIVCKGLYSVFDPTHSCGVNVLGDMLVDANLSHVVFYNSSRDYTFGADSNFESRKAAFAEKTFDDELADLRIVIEHVIDHAHEVFGIDQSRLVLYLHGTSIGGTVALMVTETFPQIKKLSLCAPPSNKGASRKPIVSTMPQSESLFKVAGRYTGDMFLLYGGNDTIVPKESSFALVQHAINARVTSLVVPNADHDFRKLDGNESYDAQLTFAKAVFDFFSRRVTT
jgi:dienelactone hydrolase